MNSTQPFSLLLNENKLQRKRYFRDTIFVDIFSIVASNVLGLVFPSKFLGTSPFVSWYDSFLYVLNKKLTYLSGLSLQHRVLAPG